MDIDGNDGVKSRFGNAIHGKGGDGNVGLDSEFTWPSLDLGAGDCL